MCGQEFANKVALVIGGASGIGEACVKTFALGGAKVAIADLDDEAGGKAVETAARLGGEAVYLRVDVTDPEAVEKMVADVAAAFGGLDIAVNNAGIAGEAGTAGDYSIDGWQRVIDANLNSVFSCMRHEIVEMLKCGGGAIVNMAPLLDSRSEPAYTTARHGVVGLTKAAALDYGRQGIRVNSVAPGFIKTALTTHDEATQAILAGRHAMGRLGEPQEVADVIAYLCSEQASFLTGGYYPVDGGYTAQ